MGYPVLRRNMRSMVRDALLDDDTSREWGRKSGATLGEEGAAVVPTGAIWGTFSQRNDSTGYVLDYSAGTALFPDGSPGRMNRYADLAGIDELRLLATVVAGGGLGTALWVRGAGEDIGVGLGYIMGVSNLVVGTWHPVTATGATLLEWELEALEPGSVTLGLVQLQGR